MTLAKIHHKKLIILEWGAPKVFEVGEREAGCRVSKDQTHLKKVQKQKSQERWEKGKVLRLRSNCLLKSTYNRFVRPFIFVFSKQ